MATKEELYLAVGALEKIDGDINYVATYAEQQAMKAVAEDYSQNGPTTVSNKKIERTCPPKWQN